VHDASLQSSINSLRRRGHTLRRTERELVPSRAHRGRKPTQNSQESREEHVSSPCRSGPQILDSVAGCQRTCCEDEHTAISFTSVGEASPRTERTRARHVSNVIHAFSEHVHELRRRSTACSSVPVQACSLTTTRPTHLDGSSRWSILRSGLRPGRKLLRAYSNQVSIVQGRKGPASRHPHRVAVRLAKGSFDVATPLGALVRSAGPEKGSHSRPSEGSHRSTDRLR